MAVVNLTKILKGKTGWVSISKDNKKLIAHARNLKNLVSKLEKMGNPDGYIMIVPSGKFSSYVG